MTPFRFSVLLLLVGLFFSNPDPSLATPPESPAVASPPFEAYRQFAKSFTFSELGWRRAVEISGTSMDRSAFFGFPPSQMVEQGQVTVRFSYLPRKTSVRMPRLELDINETSLGTLPLPLGPPEHPTPQSATFRIPPYLVTTLNSLRIRVAKDPNHPCDRIYTGPFIRIDPGSWVSLSGIRIHFPNRLSDLPLPFLYHAMTGTRTLTFLLGHTDIPLLEAAGITASWIGVKSESTPLKFQATAGLPNDPGSLPTGNLILVAATPQLPPWPFIPPVNGPTLALVDNPDDPYGKILLILGRNSGEVRTAALGLSLGQFDASGSLATVSSIILPASRGKNEAPRWIDTRKPVRLDTLVDKDRLKVSGTGSLPVRFSLPSDLFVWHQSSFPLALHYRYATLPGEERSRLDLLLNKQFQDSIPLPSTPPGASDQFRTIPVSLKDLTPFRNVLRINFNFQSGIPGILSCTANHNPRLQGTILGNSSLDLTAIPHYVRLPNLRLVPNGGYPFTRYPDLRGTAVVLPESPGEGDLRIFLHLMAFLSEETGSPGIYLSVTTADHLSTFRDRNLILIGTYDTNPLLIRYGKALPLDTPESRSRIRLESRLESLFRWSNPPPHAYGPEALAAYFKEDRNPLGVMEEDVSPLAPRKVILSLGGVSEASLLSMDRVLFDPRHFSDIFGQVSVVGADRIHSFLVPGDRFSLGHLPLLTALRFWFYSHPLGTLAALLLLSALLASILSGILPALAHRRQGP